MPAADIAADPTIPAGSAAFDGVVTGHPAELWFGEFEGKLAKPGTGSGGGGTVDFDLRAEGGVPEKLVIVPDPGIICGNETTAEFNAYKVENGNQIPADCDWASSDGQTATNTATFTWTVPTDPSPDGYTISATLTEGGISAQAKVTVTVARLDGIAVTGETLPAGQGTPANPIPRCCDDGATIPLTASGVFPLPDGQPTWTVTGAGATVQGPEGTASGIAVTASFPTELCGTTQTVSATGCDQTHSLSFELIAPDCTVTDHKTTGTLTGQDNYCWDETDPIDFSLADFAPGYAVYESELCGTRRVDATMSVTWTVEGGDVVTQTDKKVSVRPLAPPEDIEVTATIEFGDIDCSTEDETETVTKEFICVLVTGSLGPAIIGMNDLVPFCEDPTDLLTSWAEYEQDTGDYQELTLAWSPQDATVEFKIEGIENARYFKADPDAAAGNKYEAAPTVTAANSDKLYLEGTAPTKAQGETWLSLKGGECTAITRDLVIVAVEFDKLAYTPANPIPRVFLADHQPDNPGPGDRVELTFAAIGEDGATPSITKIVATMPTRPGSIEIPYEVANRFGEVGRAAVRLAVTSAGAGQLVGSVVYGASSADAPDPVGEDAKMAISVWDAVADNASEAAEHLSIMPTPQEGDLAATAIPALGDAHFSYGLFTLYRGPVPEEDQRKPGELYNAVPPRADYRALTAAAAVFPSLGGPHVVGVNDSLGSADCDPGARVDDPVHRDPSDPDLLKIAVAGIPDCAFGGTGIVRWSVEQGPERVNIVAVIPGANPDGTDAVRVGKTHELLLQQSAKEIYIEGLDVSDKAEDVAVKVEMIMDDTEANHPVFRGKTLSAVTTLTVVDVRWVNSVDDLQSGAQPRRTDLIANDADLRPRLTISTPAIGDTVPFGKQPLTIEGTVTSVMEFCPRLEVDGKPLNAKEVAFPPAGTSLHDLRNHNALSSFVASNNYGPYVLGFSHTLRRVTEDTITIKATNGALDDATAIIRLTDNGDGTAKVTDIDFSPVAGGQGTAVLCKVEAEDAQAGAAKVDAFRGEWLQRINSPLYRTAKPVMFVDYFSTPGGPTYQQSPTFDVLALQSGPMAAATTTFTAGYAGNPKSQTLTSVDIDIEGLKDSMEYDPGIYMAPNETAILELGTDTIPEGGVIAFHVSGDLNVTLAATADPLDGTVVDGAGLHGITATVQAPQPNETGVVTAILYDCRGNKLSEDRIRISGVTVISVVWEPIDSPLDGNPHPDAPAGAEGLRIFPGRQSMEDNVARNTVRVRAHIEPSIPNIPIFFRAFDIDDPSTDPVIDPEGIAGMDNLGTPKTGELVPDNDSLTDTTGSATALFTATLQPGDNFRVVASCVVDTTADHSNAQVLAMDSNTDPVTQTLTVWRNYFVETDLMTAPLFVQNIVSADYSNPVISGGDTWLEYEATGYDIMWDGLPPHDDYWAEGGVRVAKKDGSVVFAEIVASEWNSVLAKPRIRVRNSVVGAFTGNNSTGSLVLGDDDFHIKGTNLGGNAPSAFSANHLSGVGTSHPIVGIGGPGRAFMKNAYKKAYVEVKFRDDLTDYYPFHLYTALTTGPNAKRTLSRSHDFWTVTIFIAFQPIPNWDADPDYMGGPFGDTYGFSQPNLTSSKVALYSEPIAEVGEQVSSYHAELGGNAAHETGHIFRGVTHTRTGIMQDGFSTPLGTDFDSETIRSIRSATF